MLDMVYGKCLSRANRSGILATDSAEYDMLLNKEESITLVVGPLHQRPAAAISLVALRGGVHRLTAFSTLCIEMTQTS